MIVEFLLLFERKPLPVLLFCKCLQCLQLKYGQRETFWGGVSRAPAVIFGVASSATLLGKRREGLSLLRDWEQPGCAGPGKRRVWGFHGASACVLA